MSVRPLMLTAVRTILCLLLLGACSFPGSVKPTVKIGLSAPFEGLYRGLGYGALHAVRLAVRERNEAGGIGKHFLVELVALNDFNEAEEAARQAAEMAVDVGVLGVLGGWSPVTVEAATPEYERLGLAFLAPKADWNRLGVLAAQVAEEEHSIRSAVVLHTTGPSDLAFAEAFASEFVARGGEVAAQGTPSSDADVTGFFPLSLAEPYVVLVAADPPTSARWLAEARQAAPEALMLGGPALGDSLVPVIAGEAAEGVRFVSHLGPPPKDPAFVQGYEALSGGTPAGLTAGWAYMAANRLLDALEDVAQAEGRPTREGVREALRTLADVEKGLYVYVIRGGEVVLAGAR